MTRLYRNLTVAILLCSSLGITATLTAAEKKPLTLQEAIRLASEHNLDIQLASSQIRTSELTLTQGKRDFYPAVTAGANTSRQSNDFDLSSATKSTSANVTANVNLFNGYSDAANVDKLSYSLSSTEAAYERTRQSLILKVSSNYLDVATNQELVKVATENLAAQQSQLTLVDAYYTAGRRALADVYQQKANTAQSELDLLTAQNNLQISWLVLFRSIGISANTNYVLQTFNEAAKPLPLSVDVSALVDAAIQNRPDLKQQSLQLEAARQNLKMTRAGYYPNLDFSASTGSSYNSITGGKFSDRTTTTLGLNLSIPLYDRSRTSLSVQQSKIAIDNTEKTLNDLKSQVRLEVEQAILNLQTAQKQLATSDAQVEYSRQSLAAMQERYNVGAATMVELTQAQSQLVQATGNRIRTINRLLLARLTLGQVTGNIETALADIAR